MTDSSAPDVPPEVHETLTESLAEAVEAARDGDPETVRKRLETVATVATHKLPPSPLRERLLHGTRRARDNLEADYGVAVEYLRAMQRRLEDVAAEPPAPVDPDESVDELPEPVGDDADGDDLSEPLEEADDVGDGLEGDDVGDESVEADDTGGETDRGESDEQGTGPDDPGAEPADAGESGSDEDDPETDD